VFDEIQKIPGWSEAVKRLWDEDTRAEWVDGEVIRLSPASKRHQLLSNFLAALLQHFVEVIGHIGHCIQSYHVQCPEGG
jgi:hypothetical protein